MAFRITDDCISCGACAGSCPVDAISEGADHFEIDETACLECGSCADGCPAAAIIEE